MSSQEYSTKDDQIRQLQEQLKKANEREAQLLLEIENLRDRFENFRHDTRAVRTEYHEAGYGHGV